MGEFFDAVLTVPTVIFTSMLGVCLLYWLVTLIGFDHFEDNDLLSTLGFGGVPFTIVLTLVTVVGWFTSLVGTVLLSGTSGATWIVLGIVVFFVAAFLGLFVARLLVTPLRKIFDTGPAPSRADFVGRTCQIRTGTVAADFGQALVTAQDGSTAVVQVRQTGHDEFRSGDTALIYDYDTDGEFFWVAPVDTHLKD